MESLPDDFRLNYISLLRNGYRIKPSFYNITKALELSEKLNIGAENLIPVIDSLHQLNKILKGNIEVSDAVADVLEIIDETKAIRI